MAVIPRKRGYGCHPRSGATRDLARHSRRSQRGSDPAEKIPRFARDDSSDEGNATVTDTLKPDLAETGAVEETEPPHPRDEPLGRVTFRVWRGDRAGGKLVDYTTGVSPGLP